MKKKPNVVEEVVEIKIDLAKVPFAPTDFPWPFEDNSVSEISCVHIFNKIPAKKRDAFMDEAWRVLKMGGKLSIIAPYYSHMRAYADSEYEWPPICEMTFLYYNKEWRTNNQAHLKTKCNFGFVYGYSGTPELGTRAQDVQAEWIKYKLNTVLDLQVTLTKEEYVGSNNK